MGTGSHAIHRGLPRLAGGQGAGPGPGKVGSAPQRPGLLTQQSTPLPWPPSHTSSSFSADFDVSIVPDFKPRNLRSEIQREVGCLREGGHL